MRHHRATRTSALAAWMGLLATAQKAPGPENAMRHGASPARSKSACAAKAKATAPMAEWPRHVWGCGLGRTNGPVSCGAQPHMSGRQSRNDPRVFYAFKVGPHAQTCLPEEHRDARCQRRCRFGVLSLATLWNGVKDIGTSRKARRPTEIAERLVSHEK